MPSKTTIKPVEATGFSKTFNKIFNLRNHFTAATIVLGSALVPMNDAKAADLTLTAADSWGDGDSGILNAGIANDNVDVDGFVMTINKASDIGAITDTDTSNRNDSGDVLITSAVADADFAVTIASQTSEGLTNITTLDADNSTMTVTYEGAFDTNQTLNIESTEDNTSDTLTVNFDGNATTVGAITVIADGDGAGVGSNVFVNIKGNLVNGADSTLNDNAGGLSTLTFNGTGAQAASKEIAGAAAGEGTIINANTGNTVTFTEELGKTNELLALTHNTGSTTVHSLAVDAVTLTSAGTETYTVGL